MLRLVPTSTDTEILRWSQPAWAAWSKRWRARFLPRILNAPDLSYGWAMGSAHRLLRRRAFARDDILVTFGSPMSDHLAGLKIKTETAIRWIAHFSDPWADNPLDKADRLTGCLRRHWEGRVVEAADMVIFTSRETLDLVMAKYPREWAAKARVLPHAFDPDLYPATPKPTDPSRITIRHLGSLYSDRSAEPLFVALKRLNDRRPELIREMSVELVGRLGKRASKSPGVPLPPGVVRHVAPVDYLTSLRLMSETDLLLVIDAPARVNVFFPSKLADYIGARRPIFGISPEGASAAIIRELGGVVADPGEPDEIARLLEEALHSLSRGPWGDETVRARYCAPEVAKTFRTFLMQGAPVVER